MEQSARGKKQILKEFLMRLGKGGAKSVPMIGGILEEVFFGSIADAKSAQEKQELEQQRQLLHDALAAIQDKIEAQSLDLRQGLDQLRQNSELHQDIRELLAQVSRQLAQPAQIVLSQKLIDGILNYTSRFGESLEAINHQLDQLLELKPIAIEQTNVQQIDLSHQQILLFKDQAQMIVGQIPFIPQLEWKSERESGAKITKTSYSPLHEKFVGRKAKMNELGKLCRNGRPVVLRGMGGVGKTRLAFEFAHQLWSKNELTYFFQLNADAPQTLLTNLAALADADALCLACREIKAVERKAAAVLRCLQNSTDWLMQLDNVDDESAASAVLQFLPELSAGRLLITSRYRNWSSSITKLNVDELAPRDAAKYLLQAADSRLKSKEDRKLAGQIAAELDRLPLALEICAANVNSMNWTFRQYLAEWNSHRERTLNWFEPSAVDYPRSLAIAYETSLSRLKPQSAALLHLCAWLAPDPLPFAPFEDQQELFEAAMKLLELPDGSTRPLELDEIRRNLLAYSLIKIGPPLELDENESLDTFQVHRVLQQVLRLRIKPETRPLWLWLSIAWLNRITPSDPPSSNVRSWKTVWEPLHPHLRIAIAAVDSFSSVIEDDAIRTQLTRLMNEFAQYLRARALFGEAEPLMRRALKLDEASFGQEHPNVAIHLNNLAQLLKATNRLGEAEPLMRRALKLDEAALGPEHPNVARDLNNLAQLLKATNRLSEAEPLMRRALAIDEASPSARSIPTSRVTSTTWRCC